MEINTVNLGQTFTASVDFFDNNGNPYIAKSPASYLVKDFNNNQITSGLGKQDGTFPQTWTANVSIPDNAPYDPNRKYSITWTIIGGEDGKSQNTVRQLFNVEPQFETFENKYPELVVPYGVPISDTLLLDGSQQASSVSASLLDSQDNLAQVIVQATPTPLNIAGNNGYVCTFDTQTLDVGLQPYVIQWQYVVGGRVKYEYHFVYVVSINMIRMMESLRNYIDKIRFSHPNPNLRYSEADLMYYLIQGIGMLNGSKPQVTSFSIKNFPMELNWYLNNAAAYVGLSAQYLAEGVSAFDFNGQSVTLNIDRSQFIDSALQRAINVVENQWPVVKSNMIKASSPGVLWLTYSPSFNERIGSYNRSAVNGLNGDLQARLFFYNNIVNSLSSNPL